jgi:hypothetical protein
MISIPTARIAVETPLIEAGKSPVAELLYPPIEPMAMITVATAAAAIAPATSQWPCVRFIFLA